MKQLTAILLFLLTCSGICAQETERFRVREYNTENGLPSNGIKGLQFDEKTGFLWIGTEAGIVRFNGIDFKVFSKEKVQGLGIERVSSMLTNNKKEIYVFDQSDNIYRVAGNTIEFHENVAASITGKSKQRLALRNVHPGIINNLPGALGNLAANSPGNLLPHTTQPACLSLNIQYQLRYYSYRNNIYNATLLPDSNCKILFRVNGQVFAMLNDNSIRMFKDSVLSGGNIPLTTTKGDKLALSVNAFLIWDSELSAPILFDNGNAWVLDYNNKTIVASIVGSDIPGNTYIRYAQYYAEGKMLFIGTASKGLIVIARSSVLPIKTRQTGNTVENAYYAQVKLSGNSVLTNSGQVIGQDIQLREVPIKDNFYFRLSTIGDSLLWYVISKANQRILVNYNFNTGHIKEIHDIALLTAACVAVMDKKLFFISSDGIASLENDKPVYHYRFRKKITADNEPFDMVQFSATSFVFGTCEHLFKFDVHKKKLDTLIKLNGHCLRTVRKYGDYIFAGTYGGGYYMYKNGVFKKMPPDKNNFLLFTHCFVFDDDGYCWLSTNRGLFKAKTDDLLQAFEKNSSQVYYHYIGKNDGMDITEMNGGCSPCALQLDNNIISFPTMDGLLWVNTKTVKPLLPTGQIFIDGFIADNHTYSASRPGTPIALPYKAKEIEVHLGYRAWCNKENIYIEYRLDDDEKWKQLLIKDESVIKLSNLPQGNYELQIRKLNGFGIDNYSHSTIPFTVETPWYKQLWFYLLVAGVIIGLFILFYQVRTRQLKRNQLRLEKLVAQKTNELQHKNEVLEKNNTINSRLISIISHDIITPLKFLNVAGKNLVEKKASMTEELRNETIREITSTSKELQLLSTNILNWIKYQNENRRLAKESFFVHELVNQVLGILNSMAQQKKLTLVNAVDPGLKIFQYFEPLRILVYNLTTNAIHFTEEGEIVIDAKKEGEFVTVSVADKGVGMTREQIKNIMADQFIISSANIDNKKGNGLGYLIIKDLVKMMDAKLSISSEKGKGTAVSITIR